MSPSLNFIVSAPGKVILFGEHSVLYAQPALATSIDKRTTLKFQSNVNDVILEFKNIDFKLQISPTKVNIILENIASTYKSNGDQVITEGICDRNLVEGIVENVHTLSEYTSFNVAQRLSLQCVFYLLYALFYAEKKDIGAFKIEIISELVTGAGTGSSASFSVCLAAALIRYREFITGPNNTFKASAEFTDEQKSLINKWAFVCEQIIHGKASGVDNFVCTYGSMVNISFGDGSSKNIKADFKLLPNTARLRVLLVNSGVNRNTAMMVKRVSELHERNQPVTELVFMTIGEITKIAAQLLKELKNVEFDEKSDEYAKLFARLEDLVSINHGLLTSLGVSHPTLNKIIEISSQFGLKSKLTGAGGGGYVFVLVPPFYPEFKLTECKKSLEAAGFNVADATVGGKGLDIR